ncbi:leucine-rich repeat-containing protein 23 [Synchiropus splendidus]|uniref:leucine-rich repeat-containing protein 23 n=1 Tax=Synchiropus splendidus TaxID=270530 RepID=UPI00237E4963|nr:leucine-rich repeat-containing protein 23 [Synchiropus splendidus]
MDEDVAFSDIDPEEVEEKEIRELTQETINQGLSLLCRTGNGLQHAFVKLELVDKGLIDITSVGRYIHLRFLDVSGNQLSDLSPVASLTQLLWLKVDNNAISTFVGQPLDKLTFLQWLSASSNCLKDLDGLAVPSLESLNLSGNGYSSMRSFQGDNFANLVTLELRGNQLETTDGINLPNLRRLYLAQNSINRLEGLDNLPKLVILHLRDNLLENLDGLSPQLKSLQYLNIRGNAIADENALQALKFLSKSLQALVLYENPISDKTDYRTDVLMVIPSLERLDKDAVTLEEREDVLERIKELKEEESATEL